MHNIENENAAYYKGLASAIVLQAVKDYSLALIYEDSRTISDCERFFKSSWYTSLSDISGEQVMNNIKNKVPEFIRLSKISFADNAECDYAFTCPICSGSVEVKYRRKSTKSKAKTLKSKCNSCNLYFWDSKSVEK